MNKDWGKPAVLPGNQYRFDQFDNGETLAQKKRHLTPMGWNSWNAFGSGNNETLTRIMADKLVELGLDKLGYRYVVLDDGCYKAERVDGHLASDDVKFASGFQAMSDYIHGKGLKYGMYNDVGSNLCSGLEVGTRGYEDVDTADYVKWGVDFLKVDNCYNVWDNATFSNPENAQYTFAPAIRGIQVTGPVSDNAGAAAADQTGNVDLKLSAVTDGTITGERAFVDGDYVTGIGTFDGTSPDRTPVGGESSELQFVLEVPETGTYELSVDYRTGKAEGEGAWLQIAVNHEGETTYVYDDLVEAEDSSFHTRVRLEQGMNTLRLMNHRRQENTLYSYARIQEGFEKLPDRNPDLVLSLCEWGKTQPQNWGYKVGHSWRILNDITFQVGADGNPGHGAWEGAYTTSVTAQYNKAVIMDEYAGLDKGWNDPDMLMIGMDGLSDIMCKTHMTMWCMMNAPLMLGMDLRRVDKTSEWYRIISNEAVIALNQDPLGIQAKRIYTSKAVAPDTTYLRDNDRVDVLAKPLSDGSIALSFINVSTGERWDKPVISTDLIRQYLGEKMVNADAFCNAPAYEVTDLWSGETKRVEGSTFGVDLFTDKQMAACDNRTFRIRAL